MPTVKLIADSGSTKAEWCLMKGSRSYTYFTQGISPYFLNDVQIEELLRQELLPQLGKVMIDEIHYYGTGCLSKPNAALVRKALKRTFPGSASIVENDLLAAARALCGREKGVACILGTGSNSCYYNGRRIARNSPGLGYVLGDEGSGAYLGRRVLQYYLYNTYDEELRARFDDKYQSDAPSILANVYKKPLANRYLAGFAEFLAENRGHFMIENIIEDGLNDFFFHHVIKYRESWTLPVHFVGGVAWGFRDVVLELCRNYELTPGVILRNPMEGLRTYHK